MSKDKLSASEAVYGFAAWLTCRDELLIVSSNNDCSKIAALVDDFCKSNGLKEPRENYADNLERVIESK